MVKRIRGDGWELTCFRPISPGEGKRLRTVPIIIWRKKPFIQELDAWASTPEVKENRKIRVTPDRVEYVDGATCYAVNATFCDQRDRSVVDACR